MNSIFLFHSKDRNSLGAVVALMMIVICREGKVAALTAPTASKAETAIRYSLLDSASSSAQVPLPSNPLWSASDNSLLSHPWRESEQRDDVTPDDSPIQSQKRKRIDNRLSKVTSLATSQPHLNEKSTAFDGNNLTPKAKPKSIIIPEEDTTADDDSTRLLSSEEEVELSQIIREGARLRDIQRLFESQQGKEISRAEWARLANMSEKALRRAVTKYREAKSKLVMANLGLVHAVVNQMCRQNKLSKDELVQEGSLGLLRAAELFDPSKGARFSTYATWWIKGVLSNSKALQFVSIPTREKVKYNFINRAIQDFESEHHGRRPTSQELAALCNLQRQQVELVLHKMATISVLSLDQIYSSSSSESTTELYGDPALETDGDFAETLQMKADVVTALSRHLDGREALLMRLRYGLTEDGKTRSLVECADEMGISRSRAQQLASQSLLKLREAKDVTCLQEYLCTIA
mmetsp:Transcript_6259/g.9164  ORF Transcript_6259/g.9164 Transcript_6259/m.9164 type:complete len:464 (-) Transcript_6259:117-1508(-)|eukprot:CAMPEP_0172415034 /NCGR_PEP_ID=MMETSP1064-20121228/1585_1 /TAXON_ID=202472 /ORGANISM="Aulacoseira subarctica , Strain CCAP 1002/5" /LENGTH=463 /DNA_ID=CAMNT_0013151929 /DNA_START=63 /DNA_END=1454 /DNA_ORIENTATION=-